MPPFPPAREHRHFLDALSVEGWTEQQNNSRHEILSVEFTQIMRRAASLAPSKPTC